MPLCFRRQTGRFRRHEYINLTKLSFHVLLTFTITTSRRLGNGIKSRKRPIHNRKINIDPCLNQLCANDTNRLLVFKALLDRCDYF